jgi:hypothetical protein
MIGKLKRNKLMNDVMQSTETRSRWVKVGHQQQRASQQCCASICLMQREGCLVSSLCSCDVCPDAQYLHLFVCWHTVCLKVANDPNKLAEEVTAIEKASQVGPADVEPACTS